MLYADIHNRLCKKRKNKLQHASQKQSGYNLKKIFLVMKHISPQKPKRMSVFLFIFFLTAEPVSFSQEHCHALVFPLTMSRQPHIGKLLSVQTYFPLSGIRDIKFLAVPHLVKHYIMVLPPMQNTRKRSIFYLRQRCAATHRVETQLCCRIAYTLKRHSGISGLTKFGNERKRIINAVITAYHAQARCATLHCIALYVYGKCLAH